MLASSSADRKSRNFEDLIYQAALRVFNFFPLMRHQKIALAWMFRKETKSLDCLGGILADAQGLGKTLSMIALILTRKRKSENAKQDKPPAGTLIVCRPPTVVEQWARELNEKVSDESKLSVLVYHGGNRTKDPIELAKYDVVVTTYAIVTNEVPKMSLEDEDVLGEKNKKRSRSFSFESEIGTLAKVAWFRVVLDEAQTIKDHRTHVARACCGLRARTRWCLSGTIIQNKIDDLYSYFRFLMYDPYAVYKSFYHKLKVPISQNLGDGYKKLQNVLSCVMLRRTKGTLLDGEAINNLLPKKVNLNKFVAEQIDEEEDHSFEFHYPGGIHIASNPEACAELCRTIGGSVKKSPPLDISSESDLYQDCAHSIIQMISSVNRMVEAYEGRLKDAQRELDMALTSVHMAQSKYEAELVKSRDLEHQVNKLSVENALLLTDVESHRKVADEIRAENQKLLEELELERKRSSDSRARYIEDERTRVLAEVVDLVNGLI